MDNTQDNTNTNQPAQSSADQATQGTSFSQFSSSPNIMPQDTTTPAVGDTINQIPPPVDPLAQIQDQLSSGQQSTNEPIENTLQSTQDLTNNQPANPAPAASVSDIPASSLNPQEPKAEDKKDNILMERVLTRIAYALTEEDMKTVEDLHSKNASEDTIKYFLMTKVPNLQAIIQEETKALKEEKNPS